MIPVSRLTMMSAPKLTTEKLVYVSMKIISVPGLRDSYKSTILELFKDLNVI